MKELPRRGEHDHPGLHVLGKLRPNGVDGAEERLGLEHHAGAAAIGPVVHLLVLALGKIPELMQTDLQNPALDGRLEQPTFEVGADQLREKCDNVDAHHEGLFLFGALP